MMDANPKNSDYMQALDEAYSKAHELYLNYKQDPANADLKKRFNAVCKEYSNLLKKHKVDINWVYINHFGLWEYHPAWQEFVSTVAKGLKEAKSTEEKIKYLNKVKGAIIKKDIEREAFKEPTALTLARVHIDDKIYQLNELGGLENTGRKINKTLEQNISEKASARQRKSQEISEHDINTGEIFRHLYIRRTRGEKIFADNTTFQKITEALKSILTEREIVSQKWEDMTKEERAWNREMEHQDKADTFFLNHSTHIVGYSTNEPYSFDLVYYKEPCVLTYDKNDDIGRRQFRLFFGLKIAFMDVEIIEAFLEYQLAGNFEGNKKAYAKFLDDTVFANKHLIAEEGKIDKVKRYMSEFLSEAGKTNKQGNRKNETKTYTYAGDYNEYKTLYRGFRDNGILAKDTDIDTFMYVFTGTHQNAGKKQIQWLKSTRLLAYTLHMLYSKRHADWQSIAGNGKFFINKNGKTVTGNDLAKALSSSEQFTIPPQGKDTIDRVVKKVIL